MSTEEKFSNLKDWMGIFIDDKIMKLQWYSFMINFYNETGNVLFNIRDVKIPTFEEYCGHF
jgi:hypothetical protein